MKPVNRAASILLGFLVLCSLLFGTPQASPALITTINLNETVTFEFDYSSYGGFPAAYGMIFYEVEGPGVGFTSAATYFDELGSSPVFTASYATSGSWSQGFQNTAPFTSLFADADSYLQFTLTSLSSGTVASFDISGLVVKTDNFTQLPATVSIVTAPIPEPSTLLLLGTGLAGLGGVAWRRRKQ